MRKPLSSLAYGLGTAIVAVAVVLGTAACGSVDTSAGAGSTSGSSTLPKTINVVSINDQTGQTAFAGLLATKGARAAVDEINSTGFLGTSKIELEVKDAASSAQTAASLTTEAVASKKYAAILGPILSAEAMTVGPIAQKGKLPVIFTQAGTSGVLVGDYTFRATAPYPGYFDSMGEYLKGKGSKSVAVLYNSAVSSYVETTDTVLPKWKDKFGINVAAKKAVDSSTQDFTASITALVASKPDAVAIFLLGTANGTAVQQLRQAGFAGPVISCNCSGAGNLKGAGQAGAGVAWPTDFSPAQTDAHAVAFVKLFQAKYPGETPNNYAAEGYDAAWWLARAIKAANSASPEQVQKGLTEVAKTGFLGAEGNLTFEGNDMRIKNPVIVQWDGTKEVIAQ